MNINKLNEALISIINEVTSNNIDTEISYNDISIDEDPEIEQARLTSNKKDWEEICKVYKDLGVINKNNIEVKLHDKFLRIERQTKTYGYFDNYIISSIDYITNKIEYTTYLYPTDLIKIAKYITNNENIDSYHVFNYLKKGLKCRVIKK